MAAGRLDPRPAPAAAPGTNGRTLFAFRAPLRLAPGATVTLRYAYGAAQPAAIPGLVKRWRAARRPLARSERRWAAWVPRARLGKPWLARELAWAAYTVRSGASYEECAGRHVISQGGYYQYGNFGAQIAYRDPLQHMLPMLYAAPRLARDVLLYSAQQQPRGGEIAYGTESLCRPAELDPSNDMDLWLLWAAAEYGLATRDLGVFKAGVPYRDGGAASLWAHLKLAYRHQESLRGPNGGYRSTSTGDWSDFSGAFLGMTESTLVSAQLAYVYPRLAELADARGRRGVRAHAPPARRRAAWRSSAPSGPAAGTRAASTATARSAPARSSASRSRGTSSPAFRAARRRRPWWRRSGASSPGRRGSDRRCRRRSTTRA